MAEKTYRHMLSTFPSYTIGESKRIQMLFYPGKRVQTLRFAKTFRGINHRAANAYLLENSPDEDRIALFGLPEDSAYTRSMLRHPRVSALKMYYSYVEPMATRIYQFFTPEILEVAQELGKPIILHLPIPIPRSKDDLLRVIRDFPTLKIALAHLGLTKLLLPGLEETYREVAQHQQVYLDTALCPAAEVVALAIRIFGTERIMFGSDEPLHLIRSRAYTHPEKGERIITEYPYHWVDPEEHARFGELARGAVHSHWLSLLALHDALEGLPEAARQTAKHNIFYRSAALFYGF